MTIEDDQAFMYAEVPDVYTRKVEWLDDKGEVVMVSEPVDVKFERVIPSAISELTHIKETPMKPLTKQDLKDCFELLDKFSFYGPKDPVAEEIDGIVYLKNPDTDAVYMSMPKEDYEAFLAWDGKTDAG